ncbi:MAG: DUF350 domain-containing protein [Bacteroidota bacterium]
MDLFSPPKLLLVNLGFLAMYVILFFFSKWLKGLLSSYKLDEQLTEYDNNAVSVSVAGYFIAVTIIFLGAIMPTGDGISAGEMPTSDIWEQYLTVAAYSIGGILLLHLSRWLNARFILYKFSVDKEIVKDQNPGTGVVEAGTYIASAMIIAGSIYGEGGGPLTALVFYSLGQIALMVFALLYAKLSPYDVHDEIEKDNVAAGLGFSGALISIGIILMRAVAGEFGGWVADLTTFGIDVLVVFIYLIVVRFVFDKLILRNSDLNTEIAQDQNLGAGLLEMMVAICFSSVLFFAL